MAQGRRWSGSAGAVTDRPQVADAQNHRGGPHDVPDVIKTPSGKLLKIDSVRSGRAIPGTNPNIVEVRAHYEDGNGRSEPGDEVKLVWRARDQRKVRPYVALRTADGEDEPLLPRQYRPHAHRELKHFARTIWRMFTKFPVSDLAWWGGWTYSIGSALFVICGVFYWGPVAYGDSWPLPSSCEKYGGPLTFFFGAWLYQIGGICEWLEAVNNASYHGSAVRKLLQGHKGDEERILGEEYRHAISKVSSSLEDDEEKAKDALHGRTASDMGLKPYDGWRWWPTWRAVREHHIHDVGFWADSIQLFGVVLYTMTGIVVLPGILSGLADWQRLGAYWVPQMVASLCFIIASVIFMLEIQEKWWKPEPTALGWWIGVWAVIGSVGFELIAIWGCMALYGNYPWATYQSELATIWGSAGFLMQSVLQWYEAMDKYPSQEVKHRK